MIRNRHFVTKDVRAKKFYQRQGSLVENDSFGMEGNLTVIGKEFISRSAHRTPNFTYPEFQFPQFKVLQSSFFFLIVVLAFLGVF